MSRAEFRRRRPRCEKQPDGAAPLAVIGFEELHHLIVGPARSAGQGIDDGILEVIVANSYRIGVTECGSHDRPDSPLADAGNQHESACSLFQWQVGPLMQSRKVTRCRAQYSGALGLDAKWVKPPGRLSREVRRRRGETECGVRSGRWFAELADQLVPLPNGLAGGDPLPENHWKQVVI